MNNNSTHYFFQYTYFAGIENSSLIDAKLTFDITNWINERFEEVVNDTPELPDKLIDDILQKAKIY